MDGYSTPPRKASPKQQFHRPMLGMRLDFDYDTSPTPSCVNSPVSSDSSESMDLPIVRPDPILFKKSIEASNYPTAPVSGPPNIKDVRRSKAARDLMLREQMMAARNSKLANGRAERRTMQVKSTAQYSATGEIATASHFPQTSI
jgi:hypothetical protein